jgi:hypothetical protein
MIESKQFPEGIVSDNKKREKVRTTEPHRERLIEAAANVVEFTFAAGAIQPMTVFLETTSIPALPRAELRRPTCRKTFGISHPRGVRS